MLFDTVLFFSASSGVHKALSKVRFQFPSPLRLRNRFTPSQTIFTQYLCDKNTLGSSKRTAKDNCGPCRHCALQHSLVPPIMFPTRYHKILISFGSNLASRTLGAPNFGTWDSYLQAWHRSVGRRSRQYSWGRQLQRDQWLWRLVIDFQQDYRHVYYLGSCDCWRDDLFMVKRCDDFGIIDAGWSNSKAQGSWSDRSPTFCADRWWQLSKTNSRTFKMTGCIFVFCHVFAWVEGHADKIWGTLSKTQVSNFSHILRICSEDLCLYNWWCLRVEIRAWHEEGGTLQKEGKISGIRDIQQR
jgi:hypothetical protein